MQSLSDMAECPPHTQGRLKSCPAVGSEAILLRRWTPVSWLQGSSCEGKHRERLRTFQGGFALLGSCISQVDMVLGQ